MAEIENIHCPICTQPIPSSWKNVLPPALTTSVQRGDQVSNSQSKATPNSKQSDFCRKTFFTSNVNLGSKNALSVLWSSVTLLMIYQLLLTFIVDKPTTTTKLEEQIEISDLPEC